MGCQVRNSRAGDARAAAGQPDKRRQVDGEPGGLRPAGRAPAVAQAAGGPVAATDQDGELIERDRVLLPDESEQLPVPRGDLVAAPIPPCCSPGWSFFFADRVASLPAARSLLSVTAAWSLFLWCGCVLPLPPRCGWASLPWCVTSLSQTGFSSEVERGRSRTRSRRRSERQRRPTPHQQTGAGAHTAQPLRLNGRAARAGRLPDRMALLPRGDRSIPTRHRVGWAADGRAELSSHG